MGPIMEGAGLNITVFSYRDGVDLGLLADGDLVPDVEPLAAAIPVAFDELLAAARRLTFLTPRQNPASGA